MQIEVDKKDVDLRYVFGMLILWIGAGLLVSMFVDFLMHDEISLIATLVPFVFIPLGIYLMKTSRSATPVGETGYAVSAHLRGGIR